MRTEHENCLKFLPLMLTKTVVKVSSGAFSGKRFQAKSMEEICVMNFKSVQLNVHVR